MLIFFSLLFNLSQPRLHLWVPCLEKIVQSIAQFDSILLQRVLEDVVVMEHVEDLFND